MRQILVPEVEIRPFRACALRNSSGHNYRNSSFIVDVAMGQIPQNAFLVLFKYLASTLAFNNNLNTVK